MLAALFVMGFGLYSQNPKFKKNLEGIAGITTSSFPEGYEVGAWEWRSPVQLNGAERADLLSGMAEEGMTVLYINIEDYINILESGKPQTEIASDMERFNNATTQLLADADQHNIRVEALAGATDWALNSHDYIPQALTDYVIDFNKTAVHKITGIQFDIEFYNDDGYDKAKPAYARQYLDLAQRLANKINALQPEERIRLGFAVPYWMDEKSNLSPTFTRGDKPNPTIFHLLDILNTVPNSYIVIMSYRNFPDGKDGTAALAEAEMRYAQQMNHAVGIYVGQETTQVTPKKITYHSLSQNKLKDDANTAADLLREYPNFKGFSIHTADSYLKLD